MTDSSFETLRQLVEAALSDRLATRRQSLQKTVSQTLADFGARGTLHSSMAGFRMAEEATSEIRARAALIEEVWSRVLRAHPRLTANLQIQEIVSDAEARLRSETTEIQNTCSPKVLKRYAEPVEPAVKTQVNRSSTNLAAHLRLEMAEIEAGASPSLPPHRSSENGEVFVVHGHDEAAKESVARFLEKLRIKVVILHEQPARGRTIIEKFEDHSRVAFAVVLLTPDDRGGATKEDALHPRARQNVIFELGFFCGLLGRRRVCVLHRGVELPTDYAGVEYIPLVDGDNWRLPLAKELKAAGLPVDLNLAGE